MGNLVLSRKTGESIIIGDPGPDQMVIMIGNVRGNTVDVRVMAPNTVPIHRTEVYLRIHGKEPEIVREYAASKRAKPLTWM